MHDLPQTKTVANYSHEAPQYLQNLGSYLMFDEERRKAYTIVLFVSLEVPQVIFNDTFSTDIIGI